MAKKMHEEDEGAQGAAAERLAETVKASAQQIWLAGLGALSKAQEEGGKVFDALVREGATLQQRTQEAAGGKLNEAGARMSSMAGELSSRASGQWDKLEGLFEDRVARALRSLGVPSAREIEALAGRIEALERQLARGGGAGRSPARAPRAAKATNAAATGAATGAATARRPARAPARKRPAARKASST